MVVGWALVSGFKNCVLTLNCVAQYLNPMLRKGCKTPLQGTQPILRTVFISLFASERGFRLAGRGWHRQLQPRSCVAVIFGSTAVVLRGVGAETDLPPLPAECDSRIWLSAMVRQWQLEVAAARAHGRQPSLWRTMWHLTRVVLAVTFTLQCAEIALIYFASFALGWVVEYLNESSSNFAVALASVLALFVRARRATVGVCR